MKFESTIGNEQYQIELDENLTQAQINQAEISFEVVHQHTKKLILRVGTKVYKVDNISVNGNEVNFSVNGTFYSANVKDEDELLLEKLGFSSNNQSSAGTLAAPMPGKVLELLVSENDEVEAGQPVLILEAMKMENELKAPAAGIVEKILVSENDNVEKKQPLLEITARG